MLNRTPAPVATEGAGQPEVLAKLARAEQALLDCGEAVGRYEGSGELVYAGDDYLTDSDGCYLTRTQAQALAEDDAPAAPLTPKANSRA